jgi:hypothetical protein
MGRANVLSTEGQVLQGMSVGKMAPRGEEELCVLTVSTSRTELSKAVSSIWPTAHEGTKEKGFRGNAREDIKGMSRNDVREVQDYGNAVPGIGSLIGRGVNGRGRVRKSRGRVRM